MTKVHFRRSRIMTLAILMLVWYGLGTAVFAQSAGSGGPQGGGGGGGQGPQITSLYSGDIGFCKAPGLENLFSGFVCTYQTIVDEILSSVYVAMLNYFQEPFLACHFCWRDICNGHDSLYCQRSNDAAGKNCHHCRFRYVS